MTTPFDLASKVAVVIVPTTKERALYYRDLFAHKLGMTRTEAYFLVLNQQARLVARLAAGGFFVSQPSLLIPAVVCRRSTMSGLKLGKSKRTGLSEMVESRVQEREKRATKVAARGKLPLRPFLFLER